MKDLKNYVEQNKDRFLSELFELIRIPSVSAQESHKDDMYRAAQWIAEKLVADGADKAEVFKTDGHPVVYGEKIIDKSLPTVLVYGHYDVQPAEPLDLWKSPAFEPEVREGKIFARGADDDKGQSFMHFKAFEYMVKTGQLPCNVKFMIEGEEEIGSPSLGKFCEQNKKMLASDVILVSDTSMISPDIPSITTGLRGLTYVEVEVTGPNRDLHSGLYGGAVANPVNVMAKMIASLTDENGRITVKGFYDDVEELSDEERKEMARAPFNLDHYKKEIDVAEVGGEKGYSTNERTGIRPSLDVNGIWGGYTEKGAKTILPSKAYAKISMRLVPHQDSKKIAELFKAHFESIAPKTVKVKVNYLHGGEGYVSPTDTVEYQAASKAYETSFGKKPIPVRSGGSIPIISLFEKVLGVKSILMGFGLESDAIHGPNENYPLQQFYKGIETIPYFYKYYAEMKK
ncbi:MAG: dipeptidase [Bacteroidales bacterium]|jgi:acetylornithine deacetylase/succinyl-diaminopimelate desuccinylase-like protein|nr:dipeptidase [Bacteroidales bacterium]NLM91944.1 dipeptidase [Bacteroidales bacterium]